MLNAAVKGEQNGSAGGFALIDQFFDTALSGLSAIDELCESEKSGGKLAVNCRITEPLILMGAFAVPYKQDSASVADVRTFFALNNDSFALFILSVAVRSGIAL